MVLLSYSETLRPQNWSPEVLFADMHFSSPLTVETVQGPLGIL